MLRTAISACMKGRGFLNVLSQPMHAAPLQAPAVFGNLLRPFSVLAQPKPATHPDQPHAHCTIKSLLIGQSNLIGNILQQPSRSLTKITRTKGKRQTVRSVIARFKRLDWGIWIRRIAGAHKKQWKKGASRKNRMQQHVFCNATQSRMLDKMVGPYWRTPKYWVDDPYEPYQKRENFRYTRTKPQPAPVEF